MDIENQAPGNKPAASELFVSFGFGNASSTIEIKKGKFINMPKCGDYNAPIVYTIPLQILAYEVACLRGTDLDQPRNLAKSVTVE